MASEQFSLCWDNFHKNMSSGMNSLLESEDLVDVTLAVQGKCLKAHKMVLSVCSPYFKELFKSNPCQHPIVFMKDVSYEALSDLLQFMYQGEVQVSQENLTTFIKTAEALQIKGLTGDGNGSTDNEVTEVVPEKHSVQVEEYKPTPRPKKQPQPLPAPMSSPSVKRQRLSMSSNDSQPLPPSLPPQPITKTEPIALPQPVNIPSEPAAVHFKMEPYDSTQNLIDESGDDNFGEDTLDETVGDDTEDYSMMEGGTGEEEPQAGTSADGAGEGQVILKKILTKQDIMAKDIEYILLLVQQMHSPIIRELENDHIKDLPAQNIHAIQNFEVTLMDDAAFSEVSDIYAVVGGKDQQDSTRRLLAKIISHDMALTMNWSGRNDRIGFKNFKNIVRLITAVVRKNPLARNVTATEVETTIKQWLRSAGDRAGGRERRRK